METVIEVAIICVGAGVGVFIGQRLPDIDLAPLGIWRHRSAWTHSPLWLALWWAVPHGAVWAWALSALWLAVAWHLLADAFPRAWQGSAFINFHPLGRSVGALASWVWLVVSAGLLALGVVALWS